MIAPGQPLAISSSGGPDVGAFQSSLSIPAPIQITSPLSAGMLITQYQPFRITWTNGTPDAVVRMRITARTPGGGGRICEAAAIASAGEVTLPMFGSPNQLSLPTGPSEDAEIAIRVEPRNAQIQTFSVPGLKQGGTHSWRYENRYRDVKIRASVP
jgi:hypothetical protein